MFLKISITITLKFPTIWFHIFHTKLDINLISKLFKIILIKFIKVVVSLVVARQLTNI